MGDMGKSSIVMWAQRDDQEQDVTTTNIARDTSGLVALSSIL